MFFQKMSPPNLSVFYAACGMSEDRRKENGSEDRSRAPPDRTNGFQYPRMSGTARIRFASSSPRHRATNPENKCRAPHRYRQSPRLRASGACSEPGDRREYCKVCNSQVVFRPLMPPWLQPRQRTMPTAFRTQRASPLPGPLLPWESGASWECKCEPLESPPRQAMLGSRPWRTRCSAHWQIFELLRGFFPRLQRPQCCRDGAELRYGPGP